MYHRDMRDSVHGETTQDLLAAGRSFGVTQRQLQEWHRAGHLPRPTRRFLGRGKGSVSIYPPGTTDLMLALCQARGATAQLGEAAWRVWWERGGPPGLQIRLFLARTALTWRHHLRALRGEAAPLLLDQPVEDPAGSPSDDLPEPVWEQIDRAQMSRHLAPPLAATRKRMRNGRFSTLIRVLLTVASGEFTGYKVDAVTRTDAAERRIVESGLGLDPPTISPRTHQLAVRRAGRLGFRGDSSTTLHQLSQLIRTRALDEDLETAPDAELLRVREEVQLVLRMIVSFGTFARQAFPRGLWGFTVLAAAIEHFGAKDQAVVILFWRLLRRAGFGEHMDVLLQAARHWEEVALPTFHLLQQLSGEVPAAAELVSPEHLGKAIRSKRVMEQTLASLRGMYVTHRDTIEAFLVQHPEVDRLLAPPSADPSVSAQEMPGEAAASN
jgi:hypothetical protein